MYKFEKLLYSKEHEWLSLDGNIATIGISDHAQNSLGDIVYVDLPAIDSKLEAGGEIGNIESIKAVSRIYSPVSGEVTEINKKLESRPELINSEPYGQGWLFKIKIKDKAQIKSLFNYDQYMEFLAESDDT